jgi:autotransporter-associated beta strand protein
LNGRFIIAGIPMKKHCIQILVSGALVALAPLTRASAPIEADLLASYTASYASSVGGEDNAQLNIANAVAGNNVIQTQSGTGARFRIVGYYQSATDVTGWTTTSGIINWLSANNANLSDVVSTGAVVGADMVVYICNNTDSSSIAGVSQQPGMYSSLNPGAVWSAVFAHETGGHAYGRAHNDGILSPKTVMLHNYCSGGAAPPYFFTNPKIWFNGVQLIGNAANNCSMGSLVNGGDNSAPTETSAQAVADRRARAISGPDLTDAVLHWSFTNAPGSAPAGTTNFDSISNAPAMVRGNGATYTGKALRIPGGTTGNVAMTAMAAYLDLPNGIVSAQTNITIEIWATPLSAPNWARIMDFGRTTNSGDGLGAAGEYTGSTSDAAPGATASSDVVMLSAAINTSLASQRFEVELGGVATNLDSGLATVAGVPHHYAITFTDGAGAYTTNGGRWQWYRDGDPITFLDVSNHLSAIQDVNNWLGRSQWSADSLANNDYAEVRISCVAMSRGQVLANYLLGPNYVPSAGVMLTNSDASGASSFNAAGQWSGGAAPANGNAYETYDFLLRTPATSSTYTFGGNALTLSGGSLLWQGTSSSTITITNLTLNNGTVRNNGSGTWTLAGNVNVTTNGGVVSAVNGPVTLSANLAGNGPVTFIGSGLITLSGANSAFNGPVSVGNGSATTGQVGTTVAIDSQARLGVAPTNYTANQLDLNRGTLQTTATFSLNDTNRGILLDISGGTFDVASGTTLTVSSPLTSPAVPTGYTVVAGALTKADSGTLILNSPSNTFVGTLYVDTGGNTANDGAVRVANNQVLSAAHSPIYIINNNSGSSVLQLDGSSGNITLPQMVYLNGRSASSVGIENLAGTNAIAGLTIWSGGSYYVAQSDAGLLAFNGAISSGVSGTRTVTFQGSGNFALTGGMANGTADQLNLAKAGTGVLTFSTTTATYTGTTTVSGGTLLVNSSTGTNTLTAASGGILGGTGTINGPVVVQSGAVLTPGTSSATGVLTAATNAALSGTALMRINKASATNDVLVVNGCLTYGGTLAATNLGGTLQAGDSFRIFNAAGITGNFAATNLPSLGSGLVWSFNPVGGTITVVSATNTPPVISAVSSQTINENGSTTPLAVTVGDAETVAASLVMSGLSSNPALVPATNIVFGGSGSNRTVIITPATNQYGSATIALAVSDGSLVTTTNFLLTVNFVNQPPVISGLPNQIVNKNTSTGPLSFTVGDVETAASSLTVTGASSNTGLVPAANIVFGGSASNRTVTVTPATNAIGKATLTLTVSDGSLTASTSFLLNVYGIPTVSKADNPTNLNLGTSWVGGTVPGTNAIAVWDSTVTSANTVSLGANLVWGGILVSNPAGAVTLNSGNALTLGSSGIDLSLASQNLTLNCGLALAAGSQSWNVATNRTLTVGGTFARTNRGVTLMIGGGQGTVAFNPALPNSIIGPWAFVGNSGTATNNSTNGYTYATISGGMVVPYTLASNVTAFGWASGNGSATNYDVSGIQSNLGVSRTANTVRYTGLAATQNWGNLNTTTITLNGLMNAGAGTLTFAQAGGTSFGQLLAGANNELVLNAASAGIVIAIPVMDGAASSALTIAGTGTNAVLLCPTNASAYSGDTIVNGILRLGVTNAIPAGSGKGNVMVNGLLDLNTNSLVINGLSGAGTVDTAAGGTPVLTVGSNNATSTFGGIIKNTAGTLTLVKVGTGALTLSSDNTFSGGVVVQTAAGTLNVNSAQALGTGPLTMNFANAKLDNTSGSAVTVANALTMGANFTFVGTGDLIFGSGAVNFGSTARTITTTAGNLTLGGAVTGSGAFTKNGAGTLILAGTNNAFSGAVTVGGGTLWVNGMSGTGLVTVTGGTLGGNGTVGGSVTLQSGTTLSPGTNGIGVLTVSNNAAFLAGSTNYLELNKTLGTNDQLVAGGALTFGGTLVVTNLAGTLAVGDSFRLFQAGSFSGSFSSASLPALGTGLAWNTANLTNGVLSVVSTVSTNLVWNVSGTNLNLSWPSDHTGWRLQVQTNTLNAGLGTNWVDVSGSPLTNGMALPVDVTRGSVFYRLIFP